MSLRQETDRIELAPIGEPQDNPRSQSVAFDEGDPWEFKVVLTLDGGGVRGYGSLLMLRELMKKVEEKEKETHYEGGSHDSSFAPYSPPGKKNRSRSSSASGEPSAAPATDESGTSAEAETSKPTRTKSSRIFTLRKQSVAEDVYREESLKPDVDGFLPCHYFDYIGGTSTGGLNAIMLGRLRMKIDQCIGNYPAMASRIFSTPRKQIKGWPKSKHDARLLENEIKRLVRLRTGDNAKDKLKRFESPDDLCRTLVASKKMDLARNAETLYIFRSYSNEPARDQPKLNNPGKASTDLIWEVGRATAAAPTYFKPIQIGNDFYSDGGFSFNNPTGEVRKDILHKEEYYHKKRRNRNQRIPIRLIVSIGCGGDDSNTIEDLTAVPGKSRRKKSFLIAHIRKLADKMKSEVTDVDRVDSDMLYAAESEGWKYIRWTGGKDLAKLELDRWKPQRGSKPSTKTDIEGWITTYMSDPKRVREVDEIAELLVKVRRRRAFYEEGDKFQRYTYCSRLTCQMCGTNDYRETGTQALLRQHMSQEHRDQQSHTRFEPKVPGGPF